MSCAFFCQVLLSLQVADAGPCRFGVPLPAAMLERGIRLPAAATGAQLQWRRLHEVAAADAKGARVWVEVMLTGIRGNTQLLAASSREAGTIAAVCAVEQDEADDGSVRRVQRRWRWLDGSVDTRTRTTFQEVQDMDGESYAVGESRTELSADWLDRTLRVGMPRAFWHGAGVLPASGEQAKPLRQRLLAAAKALVELPGSRGQGDFARSGGVVTNLEYDTGLGLLRLGLFTGDRELLALGYRCARHTLDRDLDAASGLPFPHGSTHRSGRPEPGHAWLQGLLLAGCLFADDELLAGAHTVALGLASQPPSGEGKDERARDYAWPLHELECYLAFRREPICERAADRLALGIARRFDPRLRTFRFGEGEVGNGVYFERAWVTGGVLLPALRLHLRRRPTAVLADMVAACEAALLEQLGNGLPGIPTHWRSANGQVFAVHRAHDDPLAGLLLDGLSAKELERLLRKGGLWRALGEVPALTDPDLATAFSLLARTGWAYR